MATAAVDAPARPRPLTVAGVPAGPVLATATIVVALFALHLWLSAPMDGPLLSDGTGYLANARWLGGVVGDFTQGRTGFYYPGYSLVVSPVFRVLRDPRSIYEGVLVVNALLASCSFIAYRALARRLGLREVPAAVAAVVAVVYPSVLLQSSIEWSENLYHVLFVVLVLLVWRLVERGGALAAGAVGLTTVALYATHPRGLGVVPVVALAVIALAWKEQIPRRDAAVALGALVVGFIGVKLLNATLVGALWASDRPVTEGDILSRLLRPSLVWGTFVRSIGQIWYLLVASVGLAGVGAVELARRWRTPFALVVGATMVATLAASSLMMSDGTRVDHMVYGRYNEGFLPVLLVFGGAGLARLRGRRLAIVGAAIVGAIVVTGALSVLLDGGRRFSTGGVAPLNVFGILVWEQSRASVSVLRVSVGAIVVTAIVLTARIASLRIALVAAIAFFLGATVHVRDDVLRPWARPFEQMHVLPDSIRALPTDARVTQLTSAYIPSLGNFYQEDLLDRWAGFWDGRGRAPSPLVIGTKQPPAAGARMVVPEPGADQALWVLPGLLQQKLLADGFVAGPLSVRVAALDAPKHITASPGAQVVLRVRVEHPRGGAPWPSLADVVNGSGAVRLLASWTDGSATTSIGELPRTLLPGEHATIDVRLTVPTTPGDHVLRLTVVEEPGRPFTGDRTVRVSVR